MRLRHIHFMAPLKTNAFKQGKIAHNKKIISRYLTQPWNEEGM